MTKVKVNKKDIKMKSAPIKNKKIKSKKKKTVTTINYLEIGNNLTILRNKLPKRPDYHSFKEDILILYNHLFNFVKFVSSKVNFCYRSLVTKIKKSSNNANKVIIKSKSLKLEKKDEIKQDDIKSLTYSWDTILLYFLIIFAIGLFVGYIPFIGSKKNIKNEVALNKDCTYTEWQKVNASYCLINDSGTVYEGEYVKYIMDKDGNCEKYIRKKACN